MIVIDIDGLQLDIFSDIKELPLSFIEHAMKHIHSMNLGEHKSFLASLLLSQSPSLGDCKIKKQFQSKLKKEWTAEIITPTNVNGEWVFLKSLKSNKHTRFAFILSELHPATAFFYDFLKGENIYFPYFQRDLDTINFQDFIKVINLLERLNQDFKPELLAQLTELVYQKPMNFTHGIDIFIYLNVKIWLNKFTSYFELLFPKVSKKEDELTEQSSVTDWNNILIYQVSAEHFGTLSQREKEPAVNILYYLNQEILKSKK